MKARTFRMERNVSGSVMLLFQAVFSATRPLKMFLRSELRTTHPLTLGPLPTWEAISLRLTHKVSEFIAIYFLSSARKDQSAAKSPTSAGASSVNRSQTIRIHSTLWEVMISQMT